MSDLIDAGTMRFLVGIDESAMPSTAIVHTRPLIETPTGGTKRGDWTDRNTTPIRCRFVANTARTSVLGERLQTVADGALQMSLDGIEAESVVIDDDDEVTVTTVLRLPSGDQTDVSRYKVSAEPFVGSYATNLTVPVTQVG